MNRRSIHAVLIALLLAVLILMVTAIAKPHANVTIEASPKPTAITIDGKKAKAGNSYLQPGQHIITGTFEGFSTKTITFTLTKNKPARVVVLLLPNSSKGNAYLSKHQDEQTEREKLGDTQFDKDSATIRTIYPIVAQLPHEGPNFRIDYGKSKSKPQDSYALALYITVPRPGDEALALHWLQFAGFNPDQYELVYQYEVGRD